MQPRKTHGWAIDWDALPACPLWELEEWITLMMNSGSRVALNLVEWLLSSYLVDPASSHMLVSKIKPCMS